MNKDTHVQLLLPKWLEMARKMPKVQLYGRKYGLFKIGHRFDLKHTNLLQFFSANWIRRIKIPMYNCFYLNDLKWLEKCLKYSFMDVNYYSLFKFGHRFDLKHSNSLQFFSAKDMYNGFYLKSLRSVSSTSSTYLSTYFWDRLKCCLLPIFLFCLLTFH